MVEECLILVSVVCLLQLFLSSPPDSEYLVVIQPPQHHGLLSHLRHAPVFVLDDRTAFELQDYYVVDLSECTEMPEQQLISALHIVLTGCVHQPFVLTHHN